VTQRAKVEQLAAEVQRLRAVSGLTMRALATAAGVDVAYVSRIENGGYDLPNPLYLRGIAKALSVSPIELMLAAGYIEPEDLAKRPTQERRKR
jgi:transcriptional regulator with XRE-family HTH domain